MQLVSSVSMRVYMCVYVYRYPISISRQLHYLAVVTSGGLGSGVCYMQLFVFYNLSGLKLIKP